MKLIAFSVLTTAVTSFALPGNSTSLPVVPREPANANSFTPPAPADYSNSPQSNYFCISYSIRITNGTPCLVKTPSARNLDLQARRPSYGTTTTSARSLETLGLQARRSGTSSTPSLVKTAGVPSVRSLEILDLRVRGVVPNSLETWL